MSAAKKVVRNSLFLVLGQVLWTVFSVVLLLFSARILGVADFGNYSFAFSFVLLFSILIEFGFDQVAVREIARNKELAPKFLGNLFILKIILSIVSFVFIAVLINFLSNSQNVILATYLLGAYVILTSFASLPRYVFRAFEEMQYDAFLNAFSKGLTLVLGLAALLLGFGLLGLSFAFAFSGFLTVLASFLLLRKFSSFKLEFDFSFSKFLILESLPFALVGFFSTVFGRAATVMLSFFQNSFAVGIYSAAYKFLEGLAALPSLIVLPIYPIMSRYFMTSKAELEKTFYFAFKLVFVLTLPLSFGISLLAEPFVKLFFGASFSESFIVLQILSWSIFFTFLSSVSNSLIFAANRQKTVALFTIFATMIGVVLNFVLLPMLSFIGAAFSVVLVSLIIFLFSFYHALTIVKFSKFDFVLKSLFCSVLMSLIVLFFPLRNFFILVLLGFLAYFASMFLVHGFDSDDITLLKKVLKGKFVGLGGFSE